MTAVDLQALVATALALSVLMALARLLPQRTGNPGRVDTIWTFVVGLVGARAGRCGPVTGSAPNARQWLVAGLVAIWSLRLGLHIVARSAAITVFMNWILILRHRHPPWRSRCCARMAIAIAPVRHRAASSFPRRRTAHDGSQTKEEVAP